MDGRFEEALAAIDAANAADPETVVVEGRERPKELAHAELMTGWVERLDPGAGDAQLLAARAHHLRRWLVPRSEYPEGRAGYLRWRRSQRDRHAEDVATLLAEVGYDDATIERVQQIVRKDGLRGDPADPQVQVHEDALCLVFLQTQLDEVAGRLGDDRAVEVLAKTMRKMSPAGLVAVAGLELSEHGRRLVDAAAVRV